MILEPAATASATCYTDLRKFLDTSVTPSGCRL